MSVGPAYWESGMAVMPLSAPTQPTTATSKDEQASKRRCKNCNAGARTS